MEFRVLGSFEVLDGDRPLALGGLKQRAVLAVLTLSPNRVVSVDRLVEELWGADGPRQAVGSLQAYVSNLRRLLEPGRAPREPPRVLRSERAGYLLAVDPADIDAQRFEHAAAEGRAQLGEGRPAQARRTLGEALDLWRGPALADFRDEAFARTEATRLEELRAATLEARLAADLALGAHGTVVAELQRLVAEEPLREQLWAHLILALYRGGRQGEALAAYQECRRLLDERLGIEPNPSLRRLEADVLQQADSLDWVDPAAAGQPSTAEHAADASLAYRDAAGGLHVFPLTPGAGRLTVGRDAAADVWLSWDARVSRLHAELECDGEQWAVIDERSSNGSHVNGERLRGRRVLRNDDQVRFGDTRLTFRFHQQLAGAETYLGTLSSEPEAP